MHTYIHTYNLTVPGEGAEKSFFGNNKSRSIHTYIHTYTHTHTHHVTVPGEGAENSFFVRITAEHTYIHKYIHTHIMSQFLGEGLKTHFSEEQEQKHTKSMGSLCC
jgi:hypothetical protein